MRKFISALGAAPNSLIRIVLCLAVFSCCTDFTTAGSIPSGLADTPWPDYGGGLQNTHWTSVVGPAGPARVVWEYAVSTTPSGFNQPFRQPVLGPDGTIFFSTYTNNVGQLIALNPNGTQKWVQLTTVLGNWQAVGANGLLYNEQWSNGSSFGRIVGRNQSDGAQVWLKQYSGTPLESGPTIGVDGTVYTAAGGLSALTPSGDLKWQVAASEPQYRNPAVAIDGTIYLDGQFNLKAYNPLGVELWSQNVGSRLGPIAINADGNLFVGTANEITHKFFSYSPTGQLRWQRTGFGGAAAIGPTGVVYAGHLGTLHAMDPTTGQDLWTYNTGAIDEFGVEGVTIDGTGNLYVSTMRGVLMSLTASGSLRWQIDLAPSDPNNVFLSGPVIGNNGLVYVAGGTTRKLFAVGVPEPGSICLMAAAALIVALRRRCSVRS